MGPLAGFASKIRAQIFLPIHFACAELHARQIAIRAKSVEGLGLDSRRRACSGEIGILLRITDFAEARGPNPFAVLDGKRLYEFILQAVVSKQVEPLPNYRRGRV